MALEFVVGTAKDCFHYFCAILCPIVHVVLIFIESIFKVNFHDDTVYEYRDMIRTIKPETCDSFTYQIGSLVLFSFLLCLIYLKP